MIDHVIQRYKTQSILPLVIELEWETLHQIFDDSHQGLTSRMEDQCFTIQWEAAQNTTKIKMTQIIAVRILDDMVEPWTHTSILTGGKMDTQS